jgi:hypothetical protein
MRLFLSIRFFVLIALVVSTQGTMAQFYQGSNTEFGQNRVQYHTFFWQSYNFEKFKIYFYSGGENLAVYTAKAANMYIREIEAVMNYPFEDKLEFIVFNSQSQFKESNIGLTNESESNIGGTTRIADNKIFVYFDGTHESLNRQIRSGLAQLIAYKLLYGDNWREALRTATVMAIPEWFVNGFIKYMEGPWTTELDNTTKELIKSGKINSLNHLEGEQATLAGMAMWNYIAEVYGEKVIPNVLYMTRLSRNIENGFLYVLGGSLATITKDFKAYYHSRYDADLANRQPLKEQKIAIKSRKKYSYHNFKISPDGKFASFTTNELGQYKLWLYDVEKNSERQLSHFTKYEDKKSAFDAKQQAKASSKENHQIKHYKKYEYPKFKADKIIKGDHKLNRLPDLSYPITTWHPSSNYLTYISEEQGNLYFNIYDLETSKNTPKILPKIEKVTSMSYDNEGKRVIMSAVLNGQTDLFIYNVIGGNLIPLTNDPYDDLYPRFVENDTKVIFSSNRTDDTIRKNVETKLYPTDLDIFIIDIKKPTKPLQRMTNTPGINEKFPAQYDHKNYTYISDENGIYNRFIAYYDSTISHVDTAIHYRYFSVTDRLSDFSYNLLEYEVNAKKGFYTMLFKTNGKYEFYRGEQKQDISFDDDCLPTKFASYNLAPQKNNSATMLGATISSIEDTITIPEPFAVDINNYIFESDSIDASKNGPSLVEMTAEPIIEKFKKKDSLWDKFALPRQEIYKINYSNDYVVSQFDYNFLNNTYQRISPGGYVNPGLNSIIKIAAADVFEDYRIIGGFRLPMNFNNTEYLLGFENLKNRLDKKYLFTRRSFTDKSRFNSSRIQTYEFKYTVKYPFNEVSSLRFTSNIRYDRNIRLSTEPNSLLANDQFDYYGGLKLEYVYDVSRPVGLNILNGMRFKMWIEGMHELTRRNTDFFTAGFDFRHYQKIHRTFVWASRVAGSTSFGSQKLIYYLGGVDNWIAARFDPSVQVDPNQNFQFQTIATPMRGFYQNARNGSNFFVINNELRLPIFRYLSKNPIKSDFFNNFMVVGFADIGTAWSGWNPYDLDNSYNMIVINGKNYEILIENRREPVIYSYGGGLRSRIFGYYLKFDIAWGVDDGTILRPIKHFSLALDF